MSPEVILLVGIYLIGVIVSCVLIYTIDVVDESNKVLRLSKSFILRKSLLSWFMVLLTIGYLLCRVLKLIYKLLFVKEIK